MDALLVAAGMLLAALLTLVLVVPVMRARILEISDERDAWRARCLERERQAGPDMEGGMRLIVRTDDKGRRTV